MFSNVLLSNKKIFKVSAIVCKNCVMDTSDPEISFDEEEYVIIAIDLITK